MGNLFSFFQPLRIGYDFFNFIFGKKYAAIGCAATLVLVFCFNFFVLQKRHRNWKIYKRIKKEDAKAASLFPDKAPDDIFPDNPPALSEEKEP